MMKEDVVEYRSDGVVRRSRGTACKPEEDRCRQEFAKSSDINVQMARLAAGEMPALREGGQFADLSEIGDLHSALEKVRRADAAFMALPAKVRSAFENDAAQFVDAFQSVEGIAKLKELGVIEPSEEELADRREAAAEARAEKRREAREKAKRIAAAEAAG